MKLIFILIQLSEMYGAARVKKGQIVLWKYLIWIMKVVIWINVAEDISVKMKIEKPGENGIILSLIVNMVENFLLKVFVTSVLPFRYFLNVGTVVEVLISSLQNFIVCLIIPVFFFLGVIKYLFSKVRFSVVVPLLFLRLIWMTPLGKPGSSTNQLGLY